MLRFSLWCWNKDRKWSVSFGRAGCAPRSRRKPQCQEWKMQFQSATREPARSATAWWTWLLWLSVADRAQEKIYFQTVRIVSQKERTNVHLSFSQLVNLYNIVSSKPIKKTQHKTSLVRWSYIGTLKHCTFLLMSISKRIHRSQNIKKTVVLVLLSTALILTHEQRPGYSH